MPYIPPGVAESDLTRDLLHSGMRRENQGKSRDTFELPDPTKILIVATERISILDFVLNALVDGKGAVLTALTVFWLTKVFKDVPNHLVAHGKDIDNFLPSRHRGYLDLQRRSIVAERQQMHAIEAIVRGYLTGSGWKDYQATGKVCGIQLPEGLHDGSKLDQPIFTPSTKAKEGHDTNITEAEARALVGDAVYDRIKESSLSLFDRASECALEEGIIIADTKLEFGGKLADEVFTPDSSRFWDVTDYQLARERRSSPVGFDKQPVRDAGKKAVLPDGRVIDISKLEPKKREDCELVASWKVPGELLYSCTRRYRQIQARLTQPRTSASVA